MKARSVHTTILSVALSVLLPSFVCRGQVPNVVIPSSHGNIYAGADSCSWNAGSVAIPLHDVETGGLSGLDTDAAAALNAAGVTWLTYLYAESGGDSETYDMIFVPSSNTTAYIRSVLFNGIYLLRQKPKPVEVTFTQGTALTFVPGGPYAFVPLSGGSEGMILRVTTPSDDVEDYYLDGPISGGLRLPDAEEGTYTLSFPGTLFPSATFTLSFAPIYNALLQTELQSPTVTLSPNGEIRKIYVSSYTLPTGGTVVINGEEDMAELSSAVSLLQQNDNRSFPDGMILSAGWDDDEGLGYLEVLCPPNTGTATRYGYAWFRVGTGRLTFIQGGGGTVITPVPSYNPLLDELTIPSSQAGVGYCATDGVRSVIGSGTGRDLVILCDTLSEDFRVERILDGETICLGTFFKENRLPPSEGPIEASGANRIVTRTWNGPSASASGETAVTDIAFFNGIGLLKQEVAVSNGWNKDLVHPHLLDAFGKERREYLPYARTTSQMGTVHYDPDSYTHQAEWNRSRYNLSSGAEYAYARHESESGAAGRAGMEMLPGSAYHDRARATTIYRRSNRTGEIPRLYVQLSATMTQNGTYAAGMLEGVITIDGDGRRKDTWTDREGRIVCETGYPSVGDTTVRAMTCYGYDRCGRLSWVVTPEGSPLLDEDNEYLPGDYFSGKYCYVYAYDERGRLKEKWTPGAGAEYYVYDSGDRQVMTQDGNLREDQRWRMNYYDSLGRLHRETLSAVTQLTRASLQNSFDSSSPPPLYTSPSSSQVLHERWWGWYPSSLPQDLEYDGSVSFLTEGGVSLRDTSVAGVLTCERLNVLGTDRYLWRAYYYDREGRTLQVMESTLDGWRVRTSNRYDRRGNVLKREITHSHDGVDDVITDSLAYDNRGRVSFSSRTLNGTVESGKEYYWYDELGRLSGYDFLPGRTGYCVGEHVGYTLQGWISQKTASYEDSDVGIFSMNLGYENPSCGNTPSYSGKISSWSWAFQDINSRTYAFSYDGLSRLSTTRQYKGSVLEEKYLEDLEYDLVGNILRRRFKCGQGPVLEEQFSYMGNHCNAFLYDASGNIQCQDEDEEYPLVVDYNILNLPDSVSNNYDREFAFRYLADGTKLSVLDWMNSAAIRYVGPFRYEVESDGELSLLDAEADGGRFLRSGGTRGSYSYQTYYHITDHLGSVRAVVTDSGTPVELNDYLPFGEKCVYTDLISGDNDYLYGGKERQTFIGMPQWYDSGARFQTTGGFFLSIDPLCEKQYPVSPYLYCAGDPVNLVDPTGKREWPIQDKYEKYTTRVHSNDFMADRGNHKHGGVDINYRGAGNNDRGAPVVATHDGKIVRIAHYSDNDGGGNRIKIESTDKKVATYYMHLDTIEKGLSVGDYVQEGQQIGTMGGSGKGDLYKYNSHLHYETFVDGVRVNPAKDASSLFDPQQYISPPIHVDGGVITPAVITESTTPIPSIVPKIQ